jgi:hypothetical protein
MRPVVYTPRDALVTPHRGNLLLPAIAGFLAPVTPVTPLSGKKGYGSSRQRVGLHKEPGRKVEGQERPEVTGVTTPRLLLPRTCGSGDQP